MLILEVIIAGARELSGRSNAVVDDDVNDDDGDDDDMNDANVARDAKRAKPTKLIEVLSSTDIVGNGKSTKTTTNAASTRQIANKVKRRRFCSLIII